MSIINTALIGKLKKTKADKSNVLQLDNTVAYTPTLDYHPATKKYVVDALQELGTDTNNYVSSVSFNTSNGVLTMTRSGLTDLTVDLDGKYQDTLVSGVNIKTLNGTSLLGSGNIDIQGGSITGIAYSASLTPPGLPSDGQIWFNQETGQTFQYNVDADGTKFWLETGASAFTDTQYTLNESDVITVTDPLVKTYNFNYYTGFVQIFINRLKLRKSEFTADNGTSVTINIDLDVNDEIEIVTLNVLQG